MNESVQNDDDSKDIKDADLLQPDLQKETNKTSELESLIMEKDNEIDKLRKAIVKYERLLERTNRYNEDLRNELSALSSQLHQCRSQSHQRTTVFTQVSQADFEEAYGKKEIPDWGTDFDQGSDGPSIADRVKAAAEELQNQLMDDSGSSHLESGQQMSEAASEYVYDETSGLYYHADTGYYWDPNFGLFYDYTTGTYYKHNEKTGEYEVYSRAEMAGQSQQILDDEDNDKKVKTKKHNHMSTSKNRESFGRRTKKKIKKQRHPTDLAETKRIKKIRKSVLNKSMKMSEAEDDRGSLSEKEELILETNAEKKCTEDIADEVDEALKCDYESSGSLATDESELMSEPESGELTSESGTSDVELLAVEDPAVVYESKTEIADDNPPCIRVIVQSSEQLKCGSLYIITCAGGTIGREVSKGHAIEIQDANVSKLHAEILYDYEKHCYTLNDKDSRNGTILNGNRLLQNKSESNCHDLHHGDLLQVGDTTLLLHIHKGNETCDGCEPGQVQAKIKAANLIKNDYVVMSQRDKNRQRLRELRNIKKKYGLQNCSYEIPGATIRNPDYTDKAYQRRKLTGSMSEVLEPVRGPASAESPISALNKGHKLLSKMGWKEGQGLGRANSGIVEPINVEMRVNQSAGLGSATDVSVTLDNIQNVGKAKRWTQAKTRYQKLEDAHKIHTLKTFPVSFLKARQVSDTESYSHAVSVPGAELSGAEDSHVSGSHDTKLSSTSLLSLTADHLDFSNEAMATLSSQNTLR